MADKKTWIRNLFGHKALVAAGERDRWVPHGWAESDEPVDGEFVHMENPDVAGRPLIPWGARDYWQAVGFAPSPPEEPVNPTKDPVLRDAAPEKTQKPAASRSNQNKE